MRTAGIIAEYNPFHKGHQYHVEMTRQSGASHVVAVMSGNFVQRGEPALLAKHARAEMALANGVDLVLELPLPFALSGAQKFAKGSISVLGTLGCVDLLSFGSESGDLQAILALAGLIDTDIVRAGLAPALRQGMSFAAAREQAVSREAPHLARMLQKPNDTLAVEYCRALCLSGCSMAPMAIKRMGAGHDEQGEATGFWSASQLRKALCKIGTCNESTCLGQLPAASTEVIKREKKLGTFPAVQKCLEIALLAKLRAMPKAEFRLLPDISEGLENRLYKAAQQAVSLEELYALAKTKRYSMARIRRLAWSAFLGLRDEDTALPLPYIRVLGLNRRGTELLKAARKKATSPIVMRASDIKLLGSKAERLFSLECISTDLYMLALPNPQTAGTEYTRNVIRMLEA